MYVYCQYSSTQLLLLNSACLLGVYLCGRSRVLDVYIHPWILSFLYIHIVAILLYTCMSVDVVSLHTYILPIFVYPTSLAGWECTCVDEVACSMYIHIYRYCPSCIYILQLFDIYLCVWYIYFNCHYSFTQLRLPSGSVIVWMKSRSWYIYMSIDVVSVYLCILAQVCLKYVYIRIAPIRLLNSACLLGVYLCERSRVLDMYTYVYWCLNLYMHIGAGVSELKYTYTCCHYSSTQLRLPPGSVIVWRKWRVRWIYIYIWILSLPYIHNVAIWYIWMCLIYIYVLPLFVRVHKDSLGMCIGANVTSVRKVGTASKRDKRRG